MNKKSHNWVEFWDRLGYIDIQLLQTHSSWRSNRNKTLTLSNLHIFNSHSDISQQQLPIPLTHKISYHIHNTANFSHLIFFSSSISSGNEDVNRNSEKQRKTDITNWYYLPDPDALQLQGGIDLRLAARGFLLQFVWTTETSYMTAFCTICWVSPHAVPLAGITGLEL